MRSGGAFLLISAVVRVIGMAMLALALTAQGENPASIITFKRFLNIAAESLAGFMLWRGLRSWRGTAVFFTVAIFISGLLKPLAGMLVGYADPRMIVSLLGYLCLIVALCVTVLGEPNRRRTWIGIGIFVIGFLGLSILPVMM